MKNLVTKEVEFQGNKILAILKSGKIYVAVKRICEIFKMTDGQIKNQRLKLQEDELLKGGLITVPLATNGGMQETLVVELNYFPIWLAKINPARFDGELKKLLFNYQLWAKDILADAFFGKRKDEIPLLPEDKDWGIKRMYDRLDQAKILEEELYPVIKFLESVYEEVEGIAKIKREATFREFKRFKTPENYDAAKEKLPSLELEKNNDGSIEIKVK